MRSLETKRDEIIQASESNLALTASLKATVEQIKTQASKHILFAAKDFFATEAKSILPTGFTQADCERLDGLVKGLGFEAISKEIDQLGER